MRVRLATRLNKTMLLLGAAALIWAASTAFFTVDVTEYGVVSRFGRIVRILDQPGLYLKSPLDRVLRLDRRLLYSRPAPAEYLTADKKNVVMRSLATWRIAEPERFLRTLRTRADAEERLADLILGEIGAVLGRYPFAALVSAGEGPGRFATVVADIAAAVAAEARPAFGIDVVDVDVRKLYLPEQNKKSVFERMKAERGRMATQFRSEGERDAQALIAKADAERTRLMAAGHEQGQRIRAEGEAQAIRVYAEAFGQAPEFYKFLRTLEAYRKFLDDKTTLFLPADAEILGTPAVRRRSTSGWRARRACRGAETRRARRPQPRGTCRHGAQPKPGYDTRSAGRGSAQAMTPGERQIPTSAAPSERATGRMLQRPALIRWVGLAFLALVGAYLASGFYLVDTDEEAVVRRFGSIVAEVGPGMHYRLPWPIDRVDVLKTTAVMKTGVGFALGADAQDAAAGMELLTGDTNILSIALALQYVIQDPADFLFWTESPEELIGAVAEAVLTETVLGMPVDEVLTTGRLAIQDEVKTRTQARLDEYRSGIRITSSNIMTITLDQSVAEAFQEVTDAMADREKSRNEARMYANNLIPKTRGEAHALGRAAQGLKQERIAQAVGNTSRFLALLEEYQKAPDVTQTRLYLEAMEQVLPKVTMYVVDSEDGQVPLNLRVGAP